MFYVGISKVTLCKDQATATLELLLPNGELIKVSVSPGEDVKELSKYIDGNTDLPYSLEK